MPVAGGPSQNLLSPRSEVLARGAGIQLEFSVLQLRPNRCPVGPNSKSVHTGRAAPEEGSHVKLTPGKLAGIKAVSNDRGVIAAAAMDQRGSLKKALGTYATDAGLEEFKIHVTEALTKHASAILLDPEWCLPAAPRRAKGSGLLLAYEKTGYDKTLPGRLPDLLDVWSVKRLKEAGANCVKILLYYTPYDDQKINDHKHAWTERIGDECKANDIPFFLELVGYKEGLDEKGAEYRSEEH